MKSYMIEFEILSSIGSVIKSGKVIAHKKTNEDDAISGVNDHFKEQLKFFDKMIVKSISIHKTEKKTNQDNAVEQLMNMFGIKK